VIIVPFRGIAATRIPSIFTTAHQVLQCFQWNDPQFSYPVYPVNPCLVPSSAGIQL
jgi:hypothetical protein